MLILNNVKKITEMTVYKKTYFADKEGKPFDELKAAVRSEVYRKYSDFFSDLCSHVNFCEGTIYNMKLFEREKKNILSFFKELENKDFKDLTKEEENA